MRFKNLLICGLLTACSGGESIVLSSAEQSEVPSFSDVTRDFVPVPDGEVGYVSFGLRLNDIRNDAGIASVTENAILNSVAQDHAEDQVNNGYLDHVGLDGSTAGDRVLEGGYDYRFIAENIARGFDDEDEVIDAWMASPGHAENMLDVRAEEFGLGRENSTWVLLLGTEFPD